MTTKKRTVLFGLQKDWEPNIRAALDSELYEPTFGNFLQTDFDQFDLVVPLTLRDYWGLNENMAKAKGKALFPKPQVVALCHDKYKFNSFLADSEVSFLIPPMFASSPTIPFILKRKEDEFGANSYLIRSEEEVKQHAHLIVDSAYFAQTYIPGGHEYTTHILRKDGVIKYFVRVDYDMGGDFYVKSATNTQKGTSFHQDEPYLDVFAKMLDLLGYTDGTCCVNYKLNNNEPKVFEINPRFGGSLYKDLNRYLSAYEQCL